jgi:spore maturation protein CgeB
VAFADSVEYLARNGQRRREMGESAVERVRQHFTVDQDVEETVAMYEEL